MIDFSNQIDLQVEKILDKKVFNGKTLYLVKWKGYPIEQATWECNKLLMSAKDKIREFKYSKRTQEQIPKIHIQEDPEGQIVLDTFKPKRGRPPRMPFKNYCQAANEHPQNHLKSKSHKTKEITVKRGRGRPKGSKSRKPCNVHFQEQSLYTFESDQQEESSNQYKTITNDSSSNQLDENNGKKLKKLQKIALKKKQHTRVHHNKNQDQQEFDIVGSQDEKSKTRINMNSGEKLGLTSSILLDSQLSFEEKNSNKPRQKHQKKSQAMLNAQKYLLSCQKNSFQNGELKLNQSQKMRKTKILNLDATKQKTEKNVGTMSSQQKLKRAFQKESNQQQKCILQQLNEFQEKYHFKGNKAEKKVSPSNCQTEEKSKLVEKQKQMKKIVNEEIQIGSHSIISDNLNQNINNATNILSQKPETKNQLRITKLYHLETIELSLSKNQENLINDEFEEVLNPSFSEEQLNKMSLTRKIVEILSSSLNFKKSPSFINKNRQNKSLEIKRVIYQELSQIVNKSSQCSNEEIIQLFLEKVEQIIPNNRLFTVMHNQFQVTVQEALYLVQFNQGKIIKKFTASEILLYLIIDMVKISHPLRSNQSFQSILNITYYIKFLQMSFLPSGMKNQFSTKMEKSTVKNIKMEEKTTNKNSQIQSLLIEALKNVKSQRNIYSSDISKQNKQRIPINFDSQAYEKSNKILTHEGREMKNTQLETRNFINSAKSEEDQMEWNE